MPESSLLSAPRPRHDVPTPTLDFVVGDLVDQSVDVLIAPVGDSDAATSRVQLALRRAAGPSLAAEYEARASALPGGRLGAFEHLVTRAGALDARYVVHVRPLIASSVGDEAEELLGRCLRDGFEAARRLGATSVAVPAIGTGAYGYRVGLVARVAIRAAIDVQRRPGGPSRVRFVLAGPATLESFLHAASIESAARRATE